MGLSTHVLETSVGRPAAGVSLTLEAWRDDAWLLLHRAATDADGRCKDMLPSGAALQHGRYRICFSTGEYFAAKGEVCLYPYIEIVFVVADERHHHIPLLLTANGYTTYRGS